MKYIKYFGNTAAVGSGVEVDLPNVAYLEDKNVVFSHGIDGKTTVRIDSSTGKIYRDYASEYFTFEALEAGTFTLTIGSAVTTTVLTSISYSLDNGTTWTTTNNVNSQTVTITTPSVAKGDKVLWKGSGTAMSVATNSTAAANRLPSSSVFSSSGEFDVYGNIMSLLYSDNFVGQTSFASGSSSNFALLFYSYNTAATAKIKSITNCILPVTTLTQHCYTRMFQGCSTLIKACVLPATTLANYCYAAMFHSCGLSIAPSLPVTTLKDYCYFAMFSTCTSLTTAPELPATTLASYCYYNMFYGCTSLTTAPELPATTLTEGCYFDMVRDCTSLTTAPAILPATTLTVSCYENMFSGCGSLTTAPELPATTLAERCYRFMFAYCASLITPPVLPATTLASSCYHSMFRGCTSLTTAPELPATTLAYSCYNWMFRDCTSLTTAPELLGTTLAPDCYQDMFTGCVNLINVPSELPATIVPSGSSAQYGCYQRMFKGCVKITKSPLIKAATLGVKAMSEMFNGCSSLNEITCLATDISAENCTENWVNGVAATGTFKKNASMSSWTTGVNGIPSGWTVETASS